MSLAAVVGKTQMPDGREAGALAARMAVDQLGRNPIIQGFIFASHHLALQQVLSGASALLGDAPLLGFSTSSEITSSGQQNHSVVVALLNGNDAVSRSDWQGGFSEDSRSVTQKLIQALQLDNNEGTLLIVADGFNGDAKEMCAVLPDGN